MGIFLFEILLLSKHFFRNLEIPFCRRSYCKAKGDLLSKYQIYPESKYTPKNIMKSIEVSSTFKESFDRFSSCCCGLYIINSVLKSLIFRYFHSLYLHKRSTPSLTRFIERILLHAEVNIISVFDICVFAKRNYRVLVRVFVCVHICMCFLVSMFPCFCVLFLHDTSKM